MFGFCLHRGDTFAYADTAQLCHLTQLPLLG
jgi:hypothetical protein